MNDINELKRQYRISLITFLSTGVVASVSTGYIFFTTGSLLFLLQFLLALSGFVIHAIYLWTSRTQYVNDSHEAAHYHGKLESYSSLVGLFVVYANLIILSGISVYRLFRPSDVADMTLFSKITTAVCIIYNLILVLKCWTSAKKTGNLVMHAQLIECSKNLFSWILCALNSLVATHFPKWAGAKFVEPVFCLVLVLVVGYFYFGIFKKSTLDLLDKTGNKKLEKDIRDLLSEVEGVSAVSFRTCGKRIVVDVTLSLAPELSWGDAIEISQSISDEICTLHSQCHVHVKIDFE